MTRKMTKLSMFYLEFDGDSNPLDEISKKNNFSKKKNHHFMHARKP